MLQIIRKIVFFFGSGFRPCVGERVTEDQVPGLEGVLRPRYGPMTTVEAAEATGVGERQALPRPLGGPEV